MLYRFGDYQLDPQRYELRQAGQPLKVEPKVFDVLVYLLQHRDRVVSKDELLAHVWPQQFISEATLNSCIMATRRAVGDSGRFQRVIQTVYGRGYRFIAVVEEHADQESSQPEPRRCPVCQHAMSPEATFCEACGHSLAADVPGPASEPQSVLLARPVPLPDIRLCAACQHANPTAATFCAACGTRLRQRCPQCGQDVFLPAAFCPACGQALAAAGESALPDAVPTSPGPLVWSPERKPVTVLCCTVATTAEGQTRFDLDTLHSLLQALRTLARDVVQPYGGRLSPVMGDHLLIMFGGPVAHEDDAQRAVWTGLGILDALDALNAQVALPAGERMAVRLGVHTGLVVVGDVGAGAHHEPLALGETPHIAARLQSLAAPNTLVISAATYQLVEGYFTCEALGAQPLRGLAQPLRAYRVLRPSSVQSRLEVAAARGLTPLVGRKPEVELLGERWARVKASMGQVVVLTGEAGIGKSRLVQVLKDYVAGEAHTCLECRGSPYSQHTAWYPITELFQRWLQWRPGEALGATLGKLEALLAQAQLALDEAVPLVAGLMALPLPEERYPPRLLAPEQQRQKTLDVLLALLGALATQQPLLVIVEDLHWVDPSTLELLALLIDQAPTMPLCLMLTCRPEFQPPWGFRTHLTPLALNRLTPAQVKTMVGGMRGGEHLSAMVLEQIVGQTDGIPLFVEEVTKAVLEAGRSTDIPDQHATTGCALALAIPATLHEALLARLDRLGSAKGVAQLGATLGRQFPYTWVRAVAPLEDAPLQRDLATLVAAELLYQRGQPPRAVYTFKHALIQEAAYASVLQRVRRQTHQRLVQILEAQFPETATTQPELLAHHALRGELWDKAVTYFQHAGEQALAHSAYREARTSFEQALGAMQHLPESRDTHARAIDLHLALRTVLWTLGELGRLFTTLQEAVRLAEALGDDRRLGWVSVYLLAHFAQVGDPERALAAGQRALATGKALGERGLMVVAQHYLGGVYHSLGDYRRAVVCFQTNVAWLAGDLRQEHLGLPGLAAVFSRSHLVIALAECGAFAAGRGPAEEGVELAEAAQHPYSQVMAWWAVGFLRLRQGVLSQAIEVLERALALVQRADLQLLVPMVAAPLGAAYTGAGRPAAVPLLERAVELADTRQYLWDQALRVVWLGEAYLRAGRLAEAGAQAQRALEFSRKHQEQGHEAYTLRLLGKVAAQRQPPEIAQAEAHYQQALALAEVLGMRPLQAHCHRGLGLLYAKRGQREQARTALSAALALYRAMEMTFWLPQTEAALAQAKEERQKG